MEDSAPGGRRIVRGQGSVWCVLDAKDRQMGVCEFSETECNEAWRLAAANRDLAPMPCERRLYAACFATTRVVSGTRFTVCAPSIEQCETMLDGSRRNLDEHIEDQSCYMYRQRE